MGFDPDVSVLGWAVVGAVIGGKLPPVFETAKLHKASYVDLTGQKARKGHQQAFEISRSLVKNPELMESISTVSLAVIEGQDFYPKPNASRPEMVSKAKSLIMIAHVSGAVHSMAIEHSVRALIALPNEWKGTRSKEADHARTGRELGGCLTFPGLSGAPFTMSEQRIKDLPAEWEHALDALGMALYGVTQLHRGVWE
jgi:hypothetical protein